MATQAGKVGEGGRSAMLQSDAQEDDDLQVRHLQFRSELGTRSSYAELVLVYILLTSSM